MKARESVSVNDHEKEAPLKAGLGASEEATGGRHDASQEAPLKASLEAPEGGNGVRHDASQDTIATDGAGDNLTPKAPVNRAEIEAEETSGRKAEDDARFSRQAEPSVGPLPAQQVNAVRDRITARWHNKETIKSVDGFADLPAAIQDHARKQGSDGSDIKAVHHRGTVYLVAENLNSATKVAAAIFHEVYGHYGLAKLVGNRILAEMRALGMKRDDYRVHSTAPTRSVP